MASSQRKTNLACDTCRRRKSRCDGIRPKCSHCRVAGRECTYRPTPTSLETDTAVLSRLGEVEARLAALEERGLAAQGTPSVLAGAHQTSAEPKAVICGPPDLHTASAHKMLYCWPWIRLNMTLPDVRSESYLKDYDEADPILAQKNIQSSHPPRITYWPLLQAVTAFYDGLDSLPTCLAELARSARGLTRTRLDNLLWEQMHRSDPSDNTVPSDNAIVDVNSLALSQLLVYSLSARVRNWFVGGVDVSSFLFTLALQRQWEIFSATDDDRIQLVLLMVCCLMYQWSRPFHALGMLQSLDSAIGRFSLRNKDSPMIEIYNTLYFVLESDILTEIDGIPSAAMLSSLNTRIAEHPAQFPFIVSDSPSEMDTDEAQPVGFFLKNHVWLRGCLNKVLGCLYTTDKAYAQPHELADIVRGISTDLRQWYQTLPLDHQFVRDVTTFSITNPLLTMRMRELALRYFSCVFLLHRPVLYFFLHKDMEYSVRPPDVRASRSDEEPWVLESCRDCIENAALVIHFCYLALDNPNGPMEVPLSNWCDMQSLFAAYLVLLQVKAMPSLAPISRGIGDIERLLDMVEVVLERTSGDSLKAAKSLEILRNQRQNFDVSSPGYSIGSSK